MPTGNRAVARRSDVEQAIKETVAWCSGRLDETNLEWSFRSPELCPFPDAIASDHEAPAAWNKPEFIRSVIDTRSRLLRERRTLPYPLGSTGRLLIVFYEENNHNGATALFSKGYFDFYDNPPWDTWAFQEMDALVAWVPNELEALVQGSIDEEVAGILTWADAPESDAWERPIPPWLVDLARRVRAA